MNKLMKLKLTNFISHKETVFEFHNGKAVIVVGKNEDDASQFGNGAGKSGIIEGIAISLTGECIRPASMKELIGRHWGMDIAVVELDLYNAMYRSQVYIKRTLSASKAQKVELFVDGEEVVYSDVNEYNKQILQLIQISKEDLFNFFLITKEYYKPFLLVGDTVKKAIINRFSGADKIDGVDDFISVDADRVEQSIDDLKAKINIIKGKQEIVSDQIKAIEEKTNEDFIRQERKKIEDAIVVTCDQIDGGRYMIGDYEQELYDIRQSAEGIEVDTIDVQIKAVETARDCIESAIKEKREEIGPLTTELEQEKKDEKELWSELDKMINENESAISEAKRMQHEIEHYSLGLIKCPSCGAEFTIKNDQDEDDEVDPEAVDWSECSPGELEEKVAEIKELIKAASDENEGYKKDQQECQERIKALDDRIWKAAENIRKEIAQFEKNYSSKSAEVQVLKKQKRELISTLDDYKDKILEVESKINRVRAENRGLEADLERLNEELTKPADAVAAQHLEQLNGDLLNYLDQETDLQEELETEVAKKQSVEEWYTNFKNFKSHLANQSIKNVQDYTNMYLQQMGSDLSIQIEGYKIMSNKKLKEQITTSVLRNGFEEGSYGTFSGGERGRIDVAVILANQTLINLNCTNGGLDLLLADEIFDSIDSVGLEHIISGLQSTRRTIMIVSQVQINSLAEYTLLIRKQNKISTICESVILESTQAKMEPSSKSPTPTEKKKLQQESCQSSGKVKEVNTTKRRSKNTSKS